MNFLNSAFIIAITTGPTLLIAGYYMQKKPPKEINHFYGYRTKRSMKNKAQWDFAQHYSAKQLIKSGFWYTLSALPFLFVDWDIVVDIVLSFVLLAVFIGYPIYKTEKALKDKFESNNT